MPLAISLYSYFQLWRKGQMEPDAFVREVERIGADGVELLDFMYRERETDSVRDSVLAALAETGLSCPIFSVSNNLAKVDPAEREREVDKIRFGVDEALRFGAGVVRVFAGDVAEDVEFGPAREGIINGLASASRYAADRGVRLGLENHGKLAGRGDQVRDLIREVRERSGLDTLGANPDFGNFVLVDEMPEAAVAEVAPLAAMAHLKDFAAVRSDQEGFAFEALGGTRYVGTVVGEGNVNLAACVAVLSATGFDGWYSIEYEGQEEPMQAVPRSPANARALL